MGCLFEFIFEIFFELIIEGWVALMMCIVPEKMENKKIHKILKTSVGAFSGILLLSMVIGVFTLISDDTYTKTIGKYLFFIPLGISVIQIIIGIMVRIYKGKKHE